MSSTPRPRTARILLLSAVAAVVGAAEPLSVGSLRCEYLVEPLGVHETAPRLDWTLVGDRRGEVQTAYEILVASTPALLARDQGDLWATGKVESDRTTQIAYAGAALASRQACAWKVRVWDKDGRPSAWSAPAHFEVGLLAAGDWTASWISAPAGGGNMFPAATAWVWYPENDHLLDGVPESTRWFRRTFTVAEGAVTRARLAFSADDEGTVWLDGKEVLGTRAWNQPHQTALAALAAGAHVLAVQARNASAGPAGILCALTYDQGGATHEVLTDASWLSSADTSEQFAQPGFADQAWKPVGIEAPRGQGPWGQIGALPSPVPLLRKDLVLADKPIASARLYATALGLYELHLNGQRVGDHVLAPEWTDYRKRSRYQDYDVTAQVKRGANVLGALLADGWYSGHIGNGGYQFFGKQPALLAQLEVTYADGTSERVVSDASWTSRASAIEASDFMLGETYDARTAQALAGWDSRGVAGAEWSGAIVTTVPVRPLEGQVTQPVRVVAELKPKALAEPQPGHWTYDLGQNMVGVVRLRVTAPAGTVITLRHAEMLKPDGTIYTDNLRGAPSVDHYTCAGTGTETWAPTFTFHGFRYVELTGLPDKPGLDAVTGLVISSDTPRVGTFACSDPRLDQLQSNIAWGQRGNYVSVPTDCPQRDERLGWMGDAQVFVRTATGNADVAAFFSKWLVDVDDGQTDAGSFPDVSPNTMGANSVPAWGDAGVICPWTIYLMYGDTRILERHLPAMTRWVEYCRSHSSGLIRDKDRGNDYGDWLSIGADTPKDLIGTGYFAYSTDLLSRAYRAVGDQAQAAKYTRLFADVATAFNQRYVGADGRIKGDTQCCYAMALKFGLLPAGLRDKAAQYLADDIKAKGDHLSTGFVGVSYLLPVLTQNGHVDTAFALLLQDSFPSWLFSVKHGATTIWERWNGWTPDHGFENPGMNSFNHYSLGSCGEWMYDSLAGIGVDPAQPAYKHILIHPHVGGGLTHAERTYRSIRGTIASAWSITGGKLTLDVTIPVNTTATVSVPATAKRTVTEGGKPAEKALGVTAARREASEAIYEIGAGSYHFTVE